MPRRVTPTGENDAVALKSGTKTSGSSKTVAAASAKQSARLVGRLTEAVRDFGKTSDASEFGVRPDQRVWSVRVIRPEDMLVLDFRGVNLGRAAGRLKRLDADKPAFLVVEHQPQSLADETFIETADQSDEAGDETLRGHEDASAPPVTDAGIPPFPVAIRAAGRSRIAYKMPDRIDSIDLTLAALLDACRDWPLALDSSAIPEPVYSVQPGFGTFGVDISTGIAEARAVLGTALDDQLVAGLETAARRIAADSVIALQAGRRIAGREFRIAASRTVARLVNANSPVRTQTASAAALYLRAVAAENAISLMAEAGLAIEKIRDLAPGFYGAILKPGPVSPNRTAIEMPWRLIASPLPGAGFDHALSPVKHANRTELWHTRLKVWNNVIGGSTDNMLPQKLRYIWSPDYDEVIAESSENDNPEFSLASLDRDMLVRLTAGFDEKNAIGGKTYIPRAVDSNRMILTALGGTLDADRRWPIRPKGVDLLAWTHRLSQGRDSYVRVEYAGFLWPFGHAATLVKISERKFQWRGGKAAKDRVAILRQRFFIVVREKRRDYPNGAPMPDDGRTLPFGAIEVMLGTTPDLAKPGEGTDQSLANNFYSPTRPKRMAFWPARDAANLFNFPFVGIDAAGRRIPFSMPAMFVSEVLNTSATIPAIQTYYNGPARLARRTANTGGATTRMADAGGPNASDVDLPVHLIAFKANNPTNKIPASQSVTLQQVPLMATARVTLASIEKLTGVAKTPEVTFHEIYRTDGWGAKNAAEIFLQLTTPEQVGFGSSGTGSDSVGGIATPDMAPSALSRVHGVMSGTGTASPSQFDPKAFFAGAKLLGVFDLGDVLNNVPLGAESPIITSVERTAGNGLPERIETTFRLFQTLPASKIPMLKLHEGGTSTIDISAVTMLFKNGDPPAATVEGTLIHFKIDLVGVLIIHFDRLHFLKKTGRKPDVDVDLNPETGITFGGPLEFINTLKDYIPANGFSDPPDLQVTPHGITAGYSLGLPAVQVGILSLSNITLGASFTLPFTGGGPTARFNFAERHNTFNLTVSLIGGGGFFAIVVGSEGVKEIEAALEFGAQIAINLGVASGSVYIKGGFYFHYSIDPEGMEFEGYVELGGRLSVLGLISVSLTFHLSLAFESKALPDKADGRPHAQSRLFGQATLTVEIEILFFSASVSVKVEKTFAGSDSDPLFQDFIPDQSVWNEYCSAYA